MGKSGHGGHWRDWRDVESERIREDFARIIYTHQGGEAVCADLAAFLVVRRDTP